MKKTRATSKEYGTRVRATKERKPSLLLTVAGERVLRRMAKGINLTIQNNITVRVGTLRTHAKLVRDLLFYGFIKHTGPGYNQFRDEVYETYCITPDGRAELAKNE